MTQPSGSGRRRTAVELLTASVVAAVVLGPALLPGYLLRYDLVSVPRPVLGLDALGLGDRLPRAVPWDSVVVALSRVLPDAMVTQLLAFAALVLAGAGAARLARRAGSGRFVALLVAQWNPFVLEQLAIGHVPHLLGYAAVPWAAEAGRRVVRDGRTALPAAACWLVVGSVTPGGGLLCAGAAAAGALSGVVAGVVAGPLTEEAAGGAASARQTVRRMTAVVVLAALAQAPWVVAGLLRPALSAPEPAAVTAFATRAETAAGVVVDVLGLGGMWASGPLPTSRTTPLALASTVLLLGLAALGVRGAVAAAGRRTVLVAAVPVVLGYLVALLPHLPGGSDALVQLVRAVPAAGLLRDGHRWLGWPAMAVAVLAGFGAAALVRAVAARRPGLSPVPVLVLVAAAVVAVAPDLAWGLSGRLVPRTYPPDWAAVRAALDDADDADRVLVLPWQPFRRYAWSGPAPVLDPAPRMLPRETVVDDALSVRGVRFAAEGVLARRAGDALADGVLTADEASGLGVGWVLVQHGTPGAVPTLPAGRAVVDGPDLTLRRLPSPAAGEGAGAADRVSAARSRTVVAVQVGWALLGISGALGALRVGRRR